MFWPSLVLQLLTLANNSDTLFHDRYIFAFSIRLIETVANFPLTAVRCCALQRLYKSLTSNRLAQSIVLRVDTLTDLQPDSNEETSWYFRALAYSPSETSILCSSSVIYVVQALYSAAAQMLIMTSCFWFLFTTFQTHLWKNVTLNSAYFEQLTTLSQPICFLNQCLLCSFKKFLNLSF